MRRWAAAAALAVALAGCSTAQGQTPAVAEQLGEASGRLLRCSAPADLVLAVWRLATDSANGKPETHRAFLIGLMEGQAQSAPPAYCAGLVALFRGLVPP